MTRMAEWLLGGPIGVGVAGGGIGHCSVYFIVYLPFCISGKYGINI